MTMIKNDIIYNVPDLWTVDVENSNDNLLVILNKLNKLTLLKMGCDNGIVVCRMIDCGNGKLYDEVLFYTNDKINKEYTIVMSNEVIGKMAQIFAQMRL